MAEIEFARQGCLLQPAASVKIHVISLSSLLLFEGIMAHSIQIAHIFHHQDSVA